jgi:hypothetical protein
MFEMYVKDAAGVMGNWFLLSQLFPAARCSRERGMFWSIVDERSMLSIEEMDSQMGKGLQRIAASPMLSTFKFTPQKESDDFPLRARQALYRKSRINRHDKTAGERHYPQQIVGFLVRADFRRWARRD